MIGTFTGLRGLATLMVLAAGFESAGLLPPEFGSGLEQVGLMIVVVVSGFLMGSRHGHDRWDRYAVGEFLAARAKRLLPLYYALLVLSAAIAGWWSDWPYRIDAWGPAIRAILLIDAPGALWIVPALAQLSLLFVLIWWMWSRGMQIVAVVAVGLVACVAAIPFPTGVAVPHFLLGVALGFVWADRVEPALAEREQVVAVGGAVAFVLACINLPAVRLAHGWTWGPDLNAATWTDPLTALIVIALVAAAAAQPALLAVLASAPLRLLGRCFYPLYLVMPVLAASYVALAM